MPRLSPFNPLQFGARTTGYDSSNPNRDIVAFEAMLSYVPVGGTIVLPDTPGDNSQGFYFSRPWVVNKDVSIIGAGCGDTPSTSATRILTYDGCGIVVQSRANFKRFRLMRVENTSTGTPAGVPGNGAGYREWRPSRTVKVGTSIIPFSIPNRAASIAAGLPPNFGWVYRCTKAGGVTTVGTSGTTGATEPTTWQWRNPKPGAATTATFDAGTDRVTTAQIATPGHALPLGTDDGLQFYTDGTLPTYSVSGVPAGNLASGTVYYVRDVSASTCKLALTPGGAAIDITSTGSGTHSARYAPNMNPIVDNDVEWTPIIQHGFEIQSKCFIDEVAVMGFGGYGFNINASTLYDNHASAADSRLGVDYSNAPNGSIINSAVTYGGAGGVFLHGYDASRWQIVKNDLRNNHGYGDYDHGTFGSTHINNHYDGNEEGYYWTNCGVFITSYNEASDATFGHPVVKSSGVSLHGTVANYSGIQASRASTSQRAHAYSLNDKVAPTTPNGWHYICVEAGTSHATTEPTWKTGWSWYNGAEEQGLNLTTDTHPITTDGTAKFRVWSSDEVSNGRISLVASGSFDDTYINRLTRGRFYVGGRAGSANSSFGFDAGDTQAGFADSGTWDMTWDNSTKSFRLIRDGSDIPFYLTGSSSSFAPAGNIAFTKFYLGGGASALPKFIAVDSKPADSSHAHPTIAWHADATSGQPIGWKTISDGTWVAMPNYA
jgi:hypothetical protein